jgi:menaquinol-cytochrome c reductase iron-sulfur subunit
MSSPDSAAAGQVDPDLAEPIDVYPPGSTQLLDRRSFVIRAMAGIGVLIAAVIGIPIAGFASVPFFRSKTPVRFLSDAVPPTLRSDAWVSAGALDDFEVGVPRLVLLHRDVTDGWVSGVADVAVYVVRETEVDVVAFDTHCTHLGCPLAFASGSATFICPCHGGSFDVQGDVLSGPPPRPMIQYETRVVDGEVQVGRIAPEA